MPHINTPLALVGDWVSPGARGVEGKQSYTNVSNTHICILYVVAVVVGCCRLTRRRRRLHPSAPVVYTSNLHAVEHAIYTRKYTHSHTFACSGNMCRGVETVVGSSHAPHDDDDDDGVGWWCYCWCACLLACCWIYKNTISPGLWLASTTHSAKCKRRKKKKLYIKPTQHNTHFLANNSRGTHKRQRRTTHARKMKWMYTATATASSSFFF